MRGKGCGTVLGVACGAAVVLAGYDDDSNSVAATSC